MGDYHFYQPSQGHGLNHDPMNAIIAPRPIGWISSVDENGNANLAPYSFFNLFNYTPPILGFSSVGYKDSVKNIERTGEFCFNLVTRQHVEAMNQTSAMVAADVDEFTLAGLDKALSKLVNVPYVAGCPVVMECRKTQIVQLTDHKDNAINTFLVLGEVVGVHIKPELIATGVYVTEAAEPVLRAGGPGDYFGINASTKFDLRRP